jgi:hypothetical protein
MGIQLQCPNGHQIHARSEFAGKRGVCPQCGAEFDIPTQNEADTSGLDLDALAAAGGTSLFGDLSSGPAGQRLAARRKSAQTMRRFTLALTIAVTILACVLLFIVLWR